MDKGTTKIWSIADLPDEIIILVLHNCNYNDIIAFGVTCKKFCDVVFSHQQLWKAQCLKMLPKPILKTVAKSFTGDWFNNVKNIVNLKQNIMRELLAMSPKNQWRQDRLTIYDAITFFEIATKDELSFYYTVHELRHVLVNATNNLNQNICEKPYTLTEQYYAKIVLSYLMHTYLSIKWTGLLTVQPFTAIDPEVVINFFIQWIDPAHDYTDEETADVLNEIVKNVKDVLDHYRRPVVERKIREHEILSAVSQVLYGERRLTITSATDIDTISIAKVLSKKSGHVAALAAIYHAVARKCGVKLELICFQGHFFLEWFDSVNNKRYTIALDTGELRPKRQCPYAQVNAYPKYSYCPLSFLRYINSSYTANMDKAKNWHVINCLDLTNFLRETDNDENSYKDILSSLRGIPGIYDSENSLYILCLYHYYRETILPLSGLNKGLKPQPERIVKGKRHDSNVQFAVGMICYHINYGYNCVICDWDFRDDHVDTRVGHIQWKQLYYRVIVDNLTERYVTQEHLSVRPFPTRQYHIEEYISKDFCHFDGFAYVMNEEKRMQYPEDGLYVDFHRNHSQIHP